ncbi:hypothetical protein [Pseudalkalibacillus salsuginis]|uniref:hypothetical protein n=1 Tax=Pseudalkalibacillus salsuginis TaxID=2910972 RepID=UPI001F25CBB2|nr:hypothetical protein [Pseudalkalibacillus salsuginis]MCF6408356.1 hypothetical protein [Pseudalkalibacillus salsuginis]
MSIWTSIRSRWLNYSMDILLILMVTMWLYAPYKDNVFVPTVVVMIGSGILYELVYSRLRLTSGQVLLSIPVVWTIGYFSGLDGEMFYLAILGAVTAFRFTKHYTDPDLQQEFPIFVSTMIGAMSFFFLYQTNDQMFFVLWISIVQFCLFAFIRLNRMMTHQPGNKKLVRFLVYLISSFFLLSMIIAVFLPVTKATAFFILKMITIVLTGIFYYPLNAFFTWFASIIDPKAIENEGEEGQDDSVEVQEGDVTLTEPPDLLINMLILLSLILVVWLGYKFYKNKIKLMNYSTITGTMESGKIGEAEHSTHVRFKKSKPPSNPIRKQLFKLEKKMGKYTFGRYVHESVSEWMERINAPKELQGKIDPIYQKVRYGEQNVLNKEAEEYRKSIYEMMDWAKRKHRSFKKDKQ